MQSVKNGEWSGKCNEQLASKCNRLVLIQNTTARFKTLSIASSIAATLQLVISCTAVRSSVLNYQQWLLTPCNNYEVINHVTTTCNRFGVLPAECRKVQTSVNNFTRQFPTFCGQGLACKNKLKEYVPQVNIIW